MPACNHGVARLDLVAHAADHVGRGADEADAAARANGRQVGVFGKKAIARMQRVAARCRGQIDQRVGVQIAENRVLADVVGLVGFLDVKRVAVGIGVDGDRLDTQFGTGAHDADSDLAPVGDQYFLKHGLACRWWSVGFFDKKNAKSYHCGLMFSRVRHVEPVHVTPVRCWLNGSCLQAIEVDPRRFCKDAQSWETQSDVSAFPRLAHEFTQGALFCRVTGRADQLGSLSLKLTVHGQVETDVPALSGRHAACG